VGGPFSASQNTSHDICRGSFPPSILPSPLKSLSSPPERNNAKPQRHHRLFHVPHVQMRSGGGLYSGFNAASTASTSLASKREPEVGLSGVSTRLPPPPPPSHPNAGRRRTFQRFQCCCCRFHLPRIQTRAGGGFFYSVLMPPFNFAALFTTPQ
jgi:hypothetical protein